MFSSLDGEYTVPEASDNGDDNDSDEEDQYGDTDYSEIGTHLQKSIFTNAEKKTCPNGWFTVNYLQPNEASLGRY